MSAPGEGREEGDFARARELGVDLQFQTEFKSAEEYAKDYDLVVACDGINSLVRKEFVEVFKPNETSVRSLALEHRLEPNNTLERIEA